MVLFTFNLGGTPKPAGAAAWVTGAAFMGALSFSFGQKSDNFCRTLLKVRLILITLTQVPHHSLYT